MWRRLVLLLLHCKGTEIPAFGVSVKQESSHIAGGCFQVQYFVPRCVSLCVSLCATNICNQYLLQLQQLSVRASPCDFVGQDGTSAATVDGRTRVILRALARCIIAAEA